MSRENCAAVSVVAPGIGTYKHCTGLPKQGHLVHWSRGALPQQAARREQAADPRMSFVGPCRRPKGECLESPPFFTVLLVLTARRSFAEDLELLWAGGIMKKRRIGGYGMGRVYKCVHNSLACGRWLVF